jgi:hypothetical protein
MKEYGLAGHCGLGRRVTAQTGMAQFRALPGYNPVVNGGLIMNFVRGLALGALLVAISSGAQASINYANDYLGVVNTETRDLVAGTLHSVQVKSDGSFRVAYHTWKTNTWRAKARVQPK